MDAPPDAAVPDASVAPLACEIHFDAGAPTCFPWPTPPKAAAAGDPGPCEHWTYLADGGVQTDDQYTYDDAGRVTLHRWRYYGGSIEEVQTGYDACGNQTWTIDGTSATEFDYDSHGLLSRTVQATQTACSVQDVSYTFDDAGQPLSSSTHGPFEWDGGLFTVYAGSKYSYWPDGGLASDSWCGSMECGEYDWDDGGFPVKSRFEGNEWGEVQLWSYDAAHRVTRFEEYQGSDSTEALVRSFSYDGGVLWSIAETDTRTFIDSAPPFVTETTHASTDCANPLLWLETDYGVDGGVTKQVRTTLDERGNVLQIENALPPDFAWFTVERDNYDCFKR